MKRVDNPHEELANAIILQAVKDYRAARKKGNLRKINEIRRFFRSEYFSVLSDLDGKVLIQKLDEEVKDERKRISE